MWKYKLTFKSLTSTLSFVVESETKELIENFVYGLVDFFSDFETKTIKALQRNSYDLRKKIFQHLDTCKNRFPPTFHEIYKFFNKMDEDDYFYFLPGIELTADTTIRIHNSLLAQTKGLDVAALNQAYENTLVKVLNKYHVFSNGCIKKHIGNREKHKRVCRFCGRNSSKATFGSSAHAISKALGNNKVFLFDECDECNEKFSKEIEPDLVNYLSVFRTFFDVKSNGKSKKIKGRDFTIHYDGSMVIQFENDSKRPPESKNSYNIQLDLNTKINTQDIYRCLCKFVLSVIDESLLPHFTKTIRWINKQISVSQLPKVAETISYQHLKKEPELFVYIRKYDSDVELPFAVGEFHFTYKIISFIVPLSCRDAHHFTSEDAYSHYWSLFKHHTKSGGWVFDDFSNNTERNLTFSLIGKIINTHNES